MNRIMEIQRLRARRAQYDRLGKRHAVLLIEAQIRHLMLRELQNETRTADAWQDWPSEAYGDSNAV